MNYQDQVVVLTGASGGIGSAMAKKFTDLGAKVALLDITVDRVQALADKRQGPRLLRGGRCFQ